MSKLGNLGALTGLEIVEGEEDEEEEVFGETYDKTEFEDTRRNATTIRLETEQNLLIKRMEVATKAFDEDLMGTVSQCGTFSIFLSLRFYVKPIIEILGVLKMPFLPFWSSEFC